MGPDSLVFQVATWLIPLVVAIVLHEISHGWVANAFGDPTARDLGRLSLKRMTQGRRVRRGAPVPLFGPATLVA